MWCYNDPTQSLRFPTDPLADLSSAVFSPSQDLALVRHVDSLCRHLAVTASSLQPWDIHLSETEKTSEDLSPLQGE